MELSWYRAVQLTAGPNEPPFLTDENLELGGIYSVDGPDGIGDQYFEGLEVLGESEATWLVARTFPTEVDRFLELPIVSVRILESFVVWAKVQVERVTSLGNWVGEVRLGDEDGISSVHSDILAERPLREAIQSWPDSKPKVWLNDRGAWHPLRTPYAIKALMSVPHTEGRRLLVVPFSAETCYLVRA